MCLLKFLQLVDGCKISKLLQYRIQGFLHLLKIYPRHVPKKELGNKYFNVLEKFIDCIFEERELFQKFFYSVQVFSADLWTDRRWRFNNRSSGRRSWLWGGILQMRKDFAYLRDFLIIRVAVYFIL